MSGPVPSIPITILRELSSQVSQGLLSAATLEAAAGKVGISVGDLMVALNTAQGELAKLGGKVTGETVAGLARHVYSAASSIEGMAAAEHAAIMAAETATTAAGAGSTVASGGRLLGFFGRIGGAVGLKGTAATVAGGLGLIATLGVLTWGAATLAGNLSADSPTAEYGDAVNDPRGAPPAAPTNTPAAEERWGVYLLTNVADGSLVVSQESSLSASITCQFEGGGLCAADGGADIPTEFRLVSSGTYFTWDGAHGDFCAALPAETRDIEVAFGTKADIYGGDYWIDLISGCD